MGPARHRGAAGRSAGDERRRGPVNHVKIGVKLVIGALVAAFIGRRKVAKGEPVPTGTAHAVGGLALINVALAVFW